MWVLLFAGKPCFWLVGGETYRAGKRDCHVVIQDDRSVSRLHLTFGISLGPLEQIGATSTTASHSDPLQQFAPVTLTDHSTYGTQVYPCRSSSSSMDGLLRTSIFTSIGGTTSTGSPSSPGTSAEITQHSIPSTGETHTLVKEQSFHVPGDAPQWREFAVMLGNHGCVLQFVWVPLFAYVEGVGIELQTKLEHNLRHCGVSVLPSCYGTVAIPRDAAGSAEETTNDTEFYAPPAAFQRADVLVTEMVEPSPAVMAMLCRAVPLVHPSFFAAVRNRSTPQVPLPATMDHAPPLSPVWTRVFGSSANETATDAEDTHRGLDELVKPNPQRRNLFAGLTFVVLQESLLSEVSKYIGCAGGQVLFDNSPLCDGQDHRVPLVWDTFSKRHQHRFVLYHHRDRIPFHDVLYKLRDELGLRCVEYSELIRSIISGQCLCLKGFPTIRTELTASPEAETATEDESTPIDRDVEVVPTKVAGRKTDPNPLFPEIYGPPQTISAPGEPQSCQANRFVTVDGWVRRHHEEMKCHSPSRVTDEPSPAGACAKVSDGHEGGEFSLRLPSYPCFYGYHHGDDTLTVPCKRFRKQSIPGVEPLAELDVSYKAQLSTNQLLSRVPGIDSDDIIPGRVNGMPSFHRGVQSTGRRANVVGSESCHTFNSPDIADGSSGALAFNAFGTTAHRSPSRKRGTARHERRGGAAQVQNMPEERVARANRVEPQSAHRVKSNRPDVFDIFQLDNIF